MRLHTILLPVWATVLVGLLALLIPTTAAPDGWPPMQSPSAALGWLRHAEPVLVGFTLVRYGAIATTGYLLLTTMLSLAAHRSDRPGLAEAANRVTLPVVARLARRSAGIGLTASIVVTAGPTLGRSSTNEPTPSPVVAPDLLPADDGAVTMVLLEDDAPPDHPVGDDTTPIATQRRLPDSPPGPPEVHEPPSAGRASPTPAPGAESEPAPGPGPTTPPRPGSAGHERPTDPDPVEATWTIGAGEHLWAVAAETLRDHRPTPPSDTEIANYLHEVVALNRARLVDPDNPDLVYPGQVFELPPVPATVMTDQP